MLQQNQDTNGQYYTSERSYNSSLYHIGNAKISLKMSVLRNRQAEHLIKIGLYSYSLNRMKKWMK